MRAQHMMAVFLATLLSASAAMAQSTAAVSDEGTVAAPDVQAGVPAFHEHPGLRHVADELAELWQSRPDLFEEVARVREAVIDWGREGGWRVMNVARVLDAIGEARLLPLLYALATDDPFELEMGLRAWRFWRVGLIESAGRLGDPRSIPLLQSLIEGDDPHAPIRRAAVAALGRTGDAAAIAAAVAVAEADPEKRPAVVEGLGHARRLVAAEYLLEVARTAGDPALTRTAVRALGDWGNLMAWRTSSASPYTEEGEAGRRAIVAELVAAYPDADPVLRAEIGKSLQLVDAVASEALARRLAAEAGDGPRRAAWTELEAAMARSPLGARQRRGR
jgi:HEAT repeat protein